MIIIDTHSHIYLEEFDTDRDDVISRAKERCVSKIILPAIDLDSLGRVLKTCHDFPGFFSYSADDITHIIEHREQQCFH